jgi:hypothetical protein
MATQHVKVANALRHLQRAASVAFANERIARAAASVAPTGGHRWELPAQGWLVKQNRVVETGSGNRGSAADGSERDYEARPSESGTDHRNVSARTRSAWQRAVAKVEAGARWSREIPELAQAMGALSRVERSVESGSAGRAISDAKKFGLSRLASSADPGRARERINATRPSPAGMKSLANVSVGRAIRGATFLPSVSQREFARPLSDGRASNDGSGRAGITINSSPTVVINAPAGSAVQHDVMGALRAHREELFDQLKRESARRERAQF